MHQNRFLSLLLLFAAMFLLATTDNPPPRPASAEIEADLSEAFSNRLQAVPEAKSLTFNLFIPELDTAFISPDGETAVLWLALRDDTGRLLATEPGLALAHLSDQGWQVMLPGDIGWEETLASLPDGMLPLEHSPAPDGILLNSITNNAPLTGYFLPYAAGTARWLEGSISHFQSIPELGYPSCSQEYCGFAYDFTDAWHFPLVASKEGTVFALRDSCADGSPSCTNYIVLRNNSEQTYQIYLHLANGTIPDKLTPGTTVLRGQYIGDSDDTGYSTSQHVHFMVTDSVWMGNSNYYWGRSIDIRFADVLINNGIPRNCYEVTQFPIYNGATECLGNKSDPRNPANDWYVSGNVGAFPPTGALTQPAAGATVMSGSNPLMDVTATASDDVWVTGVRLVVKIGGQWVEIGPKITQPTQPGLFDWDVDMCAVAPFNGPVEVALRVWDHEGNVSSALNPRTIQVDHACPPPTSQLNSVEGFDSTAARLSWNAGVSGVALGWFELQWRTDPGAWDEANTLLVSGSQRSAWFAGQPGISYAFRLRAMDANSQPEPWPAADAAETSTTLPVNCIPDSLESDDNSTQANPLALGDWVQPNLCSAGNPDWFRVEIENVADYFISAPSQNGGAAVRLTVYEEDGTTILASGAAAGIGQNASVILRQAAVGSYFIKVDPLQANLFGTGAVYRLMVSEAELVFLPLVQR
ncbi:MAG: hypothetical protein CVU39_10950 [Chloroflexi bacterium HGW-Chloroflexi-10]|nr:MAG: hypothetical protein CVU39_10950 [Chloroflexi bacterium HGW-Chloroflexi-10]